MTYVLFGSPVFTRLVLEQLVAARIPPAAVVCNPDRPAGRHQTLTPPEVKRYIIENDLPIQILQPERPEDIGETLKALAPDFFVVAAYAKILHNDTLSIPRLGTIGIHSSLLPKYRGTSPVQNAILNGETETGATLYAMDEKMDHGPILASVAMPISPASTHEEIVGPIWTLGGKKLVEILPAFLAGTLSPSPQDEAQASYTKKLKTEDGYVAPEDLAAAERGDKKAAELLDRKIRALNPEPGVWTTKDGKRMKLLAAVKNGDALVMSRIQMEGEKPKDINASK